MVRPGETPSLSVLMPVYNGMPHLEQAVRSVLDQSFRDFELIIIDDGSVDGSLSVLRRFSEADTRIRLISRPNRGLVATLNELLAVAHGEFLARMDADDICYPERFVRQLARLQQETEVVALGSRALFVDPDGLPLTEFMDHLTHEEIEHALLRGEIGMLHPTVMFRRNAVERVGGYRADFLHVEDLDLFLRLGEVGRLANLPDVLLQYRNHTASVSHQHARKQELAGRQAVAEALRRRGVEAADQAEPGNATVVESLSPGELHRKWSWWALMAGHLRSARKHAALAVAADPLASGNLRLVACVVRDSFWHRS